MRRSVATVSLSGTLQEKLEAIAASRFDGVEIFENDLMFYQGSAKDARRHAADIGLAIDAFQPFRDFEGVSEAALARNLERAERKFDLMQELGAPLMLVCANIDPSTADDEELAAAQLFALAERAARRSLKIGFSALPWAPRTNTVQKAWRLIEKANHPHLGLVLNSFLTLAPGGGLTDLAALPGHRIFHCQVADAPRQTVDAATLSRHIRQLPGQGDLDVPGFLTSVLATGYTGTISLEILNDTMRAAPPRQTALDGMRSLLFLEEQVRRAAELEAAQILVKGGQPKRRRVELFDPPAAPLILGITFLEFTVDSAAEKALSKLLEAMGFCKMGRHRTKKVTLYGQGGIRIVLNREPDSFAHSYMLVHGPSVCAMAVQVDDAPAAISRALAYGCQPFESRVGALEKSIPAVRMPNGGLIYFTDAEATNTAAFETDFIIDRDAAIPAGPLTRIDHIAEALPEGQLDSWVLFYRAILGLQPEEIFVLPDPYGLVRSKAVSNRERTIRFPLNISDSRNTATARSVLNYAGAGVHHIAFETGDIFAAVKALGAAGVPLLSIPSNYYDEIAEKYALPFDLVEKMRNHNVLYDRAGDGELFHVFTLPFDDRFFFEAIQRKGGYDAYGAANAPVRMAAQAQARAGG